MITRRTTLFGLGGLLVAPAVVRASSLMRVKPKFLLPYRGRTIFDAALVNCPYIPITAAQIAQQLVDVQPIDPRPFIDLYRLLQPTPEYPNGRELIVAARAHA